MREYLHESKRVLLERELRSIYSSVDANSVSTVGVQIANKVTRTAVNALHTY